MEEIMRKNLNSLIASLSLCAALALPFVSFAQEHKEQKEEKNEHHHYKVVDVGTFGGPTSLFSSPDSRVINDRGTATGAADTAIPDPYSPNCFFDCFVDRGFVWKDGVATDLGTLPGGSSSFPLWVNDRGLIVGQSQNGSIDPLTGFPEADAVLWYDGQIISLGTLGGSQSNASAINEHDQIVGGALNTIADPFAGTALTGFSNLGSFAQTYIFAPATTETHAFLWRAGKMQDLGTLGGPDSNALVLNDRGQVAGVSFIDFIANPSGFPTIDPFFWENGGMVDIGTLGGTQGAPSWMNSRGQVVGYSDLAGDQAGHAFLWDKKEGLKDLGTLEVGGFSSAIWTNDAGEIVGFSCGSVGCRAFLWKNGAMTDLGTVAGDTCSGANSINSQGQIVGFGSADCNNEDHAFLWENGGPIVDLNTLVLPGSGLTVNNAVFINDGGEIAGSGLLPNGDIHAVLLIPCDDDHADAEGCNFEPAEAVTEAPVRQAQITHTTAATSGARVPHAETMTRFHSMMARRYQHFGTSQSSPK
jgi:probable HAF family extracellular repeat protein